MKDSWRLVRDGLCGVRGGRTPIFDIFANDAVIEQTAHAETSLMAKIYSDMAYKGRLMFGRETLKEFGFFDSVAQICDASYSRGMCVIFHSDGYIMDDLVAAGIDGVNPVEAAARRIYTDVRPWGSGGGRA